MKTRYAIALVLVAQTAFLVWMIAAQFQILRAGALVELELRPIDPRSLFRGDYVRLNYAISLVELAKSSGEQKYQPGDPVWVVLKKKKRFWEAVSFQHQQPPPAEGRVTIAGNVQWVSAPRFQKKTVRIQYGIEKFFVPEGEGRALEQPREDEEVTMRVAVDASGKAAIEALLINGKVRYRINLF